MIVSAVQTGNVIKIYTDHNTCGWVSVNSGDRLEGWNSEYVTVNCRGMLNKLYNENGNCVRSIPL